MSAPVKPIPVDTDLYIEEHHADFEKLGDRFFEEFEYDRKNKRVSSQVRNLQQIVCSATRFADIEDFVKNQMGKTGDASSRWKKVGKETLQHLQKLRDAAAKDFEKTPNAREELAYRLKLARSWVRAVVSHYLYRIALDQIKEGP